MADCLIRLTHPVSGQTVYAKWSSIVDAPTYIYRDLKAVTDDLEQWATEPLGFAFCDAEREEAQYTVDYRRGVNARRLQRLQERGCTELRSVRTGEELASFNRAGPDETELSIGDLVDRLIGELEGT